MPGPSPTASAAATGSPTATATATAKAHASGPAAAPEPHVEVSTSKMLAMLEAIIAGDDEDEPDDDDLSMMDDPAHEFDSLAEAMHAAKNGLISGRPAHVCGHQDCGHDHSHGSPSHDHDHAAHDLHEFEQSLRREVEAPPVGGCGHDHSHGSPGHDHGHDHDHDAHDLHEFEQSLRREVEAPPVGGNEVDKLICDLAGLGGLGARPEDLGQYLLGTEEAGTFASLADLSGIGEGGGGGGGGGLFADTLGDFGLDEAEAETEPRPPGFIDPMTGWSDLHRAARTS